MTPAAGSDLVELTRELDRELDRVVDRLRHLAVVRLAQPAPGWASRADAARDVAQRLADLAQDVEGGAGERRTLPRLHDAAVGDQLATTGYDLVLALTGHGSDTQASVAARQGIDALKQLRHSL